MPNVVRFKAGVTLNGLAPAGAEILAAVVGAAHFFKRDITVTCGTDSHPPSDPHTVGAALDVRTSDMPEATIFAFVKWVQKTLGPDFTVLYEVPTKPVGVLAAVAYVNHGASAPHCHIQLRKGFGPYPPVVGTDAA